MTDEYKEKIANIEKQGALQNQFNEEVIKPFIIEVKASLKDNPGRKEFDDVKLRAHDTPTKEEFDELKKEVDTKVSGKTVGIVATALGIFLSILSFIFNYSPRG